MVGWAKVTHGEWRWGRSGDEDVALELAAIRRRGGCWGRVGAKTRTRTLTTLVAVELAAGTRALLKLKAWQLARDTQQQVAQ